MKKAEVQPPIESTDPKSDKETNENSDEMSISTDEPAPKKQRLSNKEYKKLRSGQNKVREASDEISFQVKVQIFDLLSQVRPLPFKARKEDNLCSSFFNSPDGKDCKFTNCKFIHDVEQYLTKKPEDIGSMCHIYSTRGFCARGLTCRFAKSHIDENGKNIKSESYDASAAIESVNHITNG